MKSNKGLQATHRGARVLRTGQRLFLSTANVTPINATIANSTATTWVAPRTV